MANFGFASDFSEPSDQDKHKVIWYPRNQTWKHLMLFFSSLSGLQVDRATKEFIDSGKEVVVFGFTFFSTHYGTFSLFMEFFSIFGSFFHLSFSDCFQI